MTELGEMKNVQSVDDGLLQFVAALLVASFGLGCGGCAVGPGHCAGVRLRETAYPVHGTVTLVIPGGVYSPGRGGTSEGQVPSIDKEIPNGSVACGREHARGGGVHAARTLMATPVLPRLEVGQGRPCCRSSISTRGSGSSLRQSVLSDDRAVCKVQFLEPESGRLVHPEFTGDPDHLRLQGRIESMRFCRPFRRLPRSPIDVDPVGRRNR